LKHTTVILPSKYYVVCKITPKPGPWTCPPKHNHCRSVIESTESSSPDRLPDGASTQKTASNSTRHVSSCNLVGTECSRNPIRIGLIICSVASFVELQSTYPFCLGSSCYSCCILVRMLPISKRVRLFCYLELVLIMIEPSGRSFVRSFNMCCSFMCDSYNATHSCCRMNQSNRIESITS
jgi:hypothetical protein